MSASPPSEFRLPKQLLAHFKRGDYSSQNGTNVDTISRALTSDILASSSNLKTAARGGELVFERNYTLSHLPYHGEIDVAIGRPKSMSRQQQLGSPTQMTSETVGEVLLGFDTVSLISSVEKNKRNRINEVFSFYNAVYDISPLSATAALVTINVTDIEADPRDLIAEYRDFEFAEGSPAQSLDALCVFPIRYNPDRPEDTEFAWEFVDGMDELHYETFLDVAVRALERRYEGEYQVTQASLNHILKETESEVIEFERVVPQSDSGISREAAAFANHKGGTILYGVEDDGTVVGLKDPNAAKEQVTVAISKVEPYIDWSYEIAQWEDKQILIVNIRKATEVPVSFNSIFDTRVGPTRDRMTGHQIVERFPRGS